MTLDPNFLTGLGCALATFLSATGSAIATGHGAIYAINRTNANAANHGIYNGYIKAFVPVVIAGVLAIYGSIISYLLVWKFDTELTTMDGIKYLSAGLAVGLAGLASGCGMSIFLKQLNEKTASKNCSISINSLGQSSNVDESTPLIQRSNGGQIISIDTYGDEGFTKTVLSLIYLEAIGLYGLIVALFLVGKS